MTTTVDDLVAQLTLDEKVLLLAGRDYWHTNAVERLGLPAMRLSDGPSGVRGERSVGPISVSFPSGIAIGATFDEAAATDLASALADECLDKQVHVLLGPTVNLHRHPLGGRHFESYSEDPWLSARLAVAYVAALQLRGVSATVKHLVANDSEFERHTISSDVDESVLRELYYLPFEAAVHDAGAWAVMSSYNRLNGTYAAEHAELLGQVLRKDWAANTLVMSDWFGTQSTAPSANAGLDLEMPGPPAHYGPKLRAAVESGEVPIETIDEHVGRIILLAQRTGAWRDAGAAQSRPPAATTVADRLATARRLASSSFVLLDNAALLLPLDLPAGATVAVIGPNAASTAAQGGGSARVSATGRCSILTSLRRRLEAAGVSVVYERGCVTWAATPAMEADFHMEYFAAAKEAEPVDAAVVRWEHDAALGHFTWLGDPVTDAGLSDGYWRAVCRTTFTPSESGEWMFSLTQVGHARLTIDGQTVVDAMGDVGRSRSFFGFGSAEAKGTIALTAGRQYEMEVEYQPRGGYSLCGLMIGALPPVGSDTELLEAAVRAATTADAVICVVGTTAEWETEGHDRDAMGLPGTQDELIRRLTAANPRTCVLINAGSPVSMDWAENAGAVAQIWFPGEQGGEAVADVLLGDVDPGGRLPTTIPYRLEDTPAFAHYPGSEGHVAYGEGMLIGYRYYDTASIQPRYCFGHGLSYTTFDLTGIDVAVLRGLGAEALPPGLAGEALVRVSATITNTGRRSGVEVVQCYVAPAEPTDGRPVQQLRGVAKVVLAAGESSQVVITLNERSFASWDHSVHAFVAEAGAYEIRLGRSSRDIQARLSIDLS